MQLVNLMMRLMFHTNYYSQVSRICKAFGNGSSANIKLSKTQLSKIVQLVGFGSLQPMGTLMDPFNIVLKIREKFRGLGLILKNNETN